MIMARYIDPEFPQILGNLKAYFKFYNSIIVNYRIVLKTAFRGYKNVQLKKTVSFAQKYQSHGLTKQNRIVLYPVFNNYKNVQL